MIRGLYRLLSVAGDVKSATRGPGPFARARIRATRPHYAIADPDGAA